MKDRDVARTRNGVRLPAPVILLLLLLPLYLPAAELINDGWSDGQGVAFQAGFVSGEMGAARFVPTGSCPCFLSQVTLLYGGAGDTRTVRVHVWEDGIGSWLPGPEIFAGDFELTGADDALQVIDLSATGIFVNGPFRVGIEFFDDGLPAIASDLDGSIQAGSNFIFEATLGWVDSALLGLTGDWVIRATVEEQGEDADELKNDSWPPSLAAHFQAGFVAGEVAAIRVVPPGPCPCSLDGASVLIGGAPGFADIGIRVWDDSALTDNPGALLFSDDLQLAAANATLNVIPLALENIQVGGAFRLGFEMLNAGLPSVARDDGGITPGVNFVDEDSLGWVESGSLGLAGDWIARAVVTDQNQNTTVLGYDDWDDFALPAFQDGFVAGEIAAVRLEPTTPCPCLIERVRLMFGGAAGDILVTLRIWEDTGALAPGGELYAAPHMLSANEVALNTIDLSGGPIVVNGPFRVGIEFSAAGVPSVARDHDGTLPGRNFIFDEDSNWIDATSAAVPGDWIIRATVVTDVMMLSGFE